MPLVPTQIFSSLFDFANFAVLYVISRKNKGDGLTSALYLIFYGIGRFVIEFFRGDLIRGSVGSLSTSQFISIFIVAFGLALFFRVWRGQKKAEPAD